MENERAAVAQQLQSANKALASAKKECAGLRMLLADKTDMLDQGTRDLARAQKLVSVDEAHTVAAP